MAVAVPGLTILTTATHQSALGMMNPRTLLGGQVQGGTGYLAGEILVFWLAGVFVRGRRQAAASHHSVRQQGLATTSRRPPNPG